MRVVKVVKIEIGTPAIIGVDGERIPLDTDEKFHEFLRGSCLHMARNALRPLEEGDAPWLRYMELVIPLRQFPLRFGPKNGWEPEVKELAQRLEAAIRENAQSFGFDLPDILVESAPESGALDA